MSEFNYGGQAVIEGVMMRGSKAMAVAVRRPDGGIEIHSEPLTSRVYTSRLSKLPFVRGLALLWDALGLGIRALLFSADVAIADEEDIEFSGAIAWGTVAVALLLGIGIFFVLPLLIVGFLDRWITSDLVSNLVEGVIRLAIFLAYIVLVGRMEDIQRVFSYHGAEHKTINAYEDDADLTPASVARYSTLHPRCGTGFLLVVMVVSILVFSLLGRPSLIPRLISRVILIPVIAGISYEVIRFGAKHYSNRLVRTVLYPSLALQRLTTNEPTSDMLEVAICALKRVLIAEGLIEETAMEEPALEEVPAIA
ncbi:MAG: DUF1385 domain-containing protein [Chloroflexi bacterium]|nr:MAG: DUF1385 domain-containing protein [Chloroflexota bacterium]